MTQTEADKIDRLTERVTEFAISAAETAVEVKNIGKDFRSHMVEENSDRKDLIHALNGKASSADLAVLQEEVIWQRRTIIFGAIIWILATVGSAVFTYSLAN